MSALVVVSTSFATSRISICGEVDVLWCKTEAILSVGLILWSEISMEADAGVSQFKSMLAFASLSTGDTESPELLGADGSSGDSLSLA